MKLPSQRVFVIVYVTFSGAWFLSWWHLPNLEVNDIREVPPLVLKSFIVFTFVISRWMHLIII
jgi:hypothetical protein